MYCPYCMTKNEEDSRLCSICGKPQKVQNEIHQLPVGTILENRYYVGAVIRQGGFGITYVGCDTRLEKKVAIKEYYPSGLVNRMSQYSQEITITAGDQTPIYEKEKLRFSSEAKILAEFAKEKSIVNVTDIFSEHNTVYMVMEYVDGTDLDKYLKSHAKMSFDEAFSMMRPIIETLDRVHAKGLIHRDISPTNIKVLDDKTAILLDFGVARQFDANEEKSYSMILKPGYAPMEQYQTHGIQNPSTDVYAICATLYKMITGITPENAIDRLVNDTVKSPSEVGAVIDKHNEEVLMKGMKVTQSERISSMKELYNGFSIVNSEGKDLTDDFTTRISFERGNVENTKDDNDTEKTYGIFISDKQSVKEKSDETEWLFPGERQITTTNVVSDEESKSKDEMPRKRSFVWIALIVVFIFSVMLGVITSSRKQGSVEEIIVEKNKDSVKKETSDFKHENSNASETQSITESDYTEGTTREITYVKTEPEISSATIKTILPKEKVNIVGELFDMDNSLWYRISSGGIIGYVQADCLIDLSKVTTEIENYNVAADKDSSSESPSEQEESEEIHVMDYPYEDNGYIVFGHYEQDGNNSNGKEAIEWECINHGEKGSILLVSRYVLDCQVYDPQEYNYDGTNDMTWEKCYLRSWLNNDFFNSAFTSNEQKYIMSVKLNNDDNPYYGTEGGDETIDKVFCLSLDEIYASYNDLKKADSKNTYCGEQLMIPPTVYARQKGVSVNIIKENQYDYWELERKGLERGVIGKVCSSWWLRSPGQNGGFASSVCGQYGQVGKRYQDFTSATMIGVRPAIYIQMEDN